MPPNPTREKLPSDLRAQLDELADLQGLLEYVCERLGCDGGNQTVRFSYTEGRLRSAGIDHHRITLSELSGIVWRSRPARPGPPVEPWP